MHRADHSHRVTNPRRLAKSYYNFDQTMRSDNTPTPRHIAMSGRLVVGQLTNSSRFLLISLIVTNKFMYHKLIQSVSKIHGCFFLASSCSSSVILGRLSITRISSADFPTSSVLTRKQAISSKLWISCVSVGIMVSVEKEDEWVRDLCDTSIVEGGQDNQK